MDDAGPVGRVERVGDLDGDLERLIERERAPRQARVERLALQVLHDEIRDRLPCACRRGVLAHVVQRADVRVIER